MIKHGGRSTSKPRTWTRFAALLAVFVLSFLTIRLLAGRSAGGYRPLPFFHFFFSDTIHLGKWESDWVLPGPAPDQAWQSWSETRRRVFRADAQDDYADIGALEVSAYTPQRGTFGKDSAVVNRRIRKDGITTIENIQLSIAKSAYNQAEFVTLFVRGSDGQWSVGVARFKRVR